MKTLIAVSDTHGNRSFYDTVGTVLAESDYIVHLGDTSADGREILKSYPDKTTVINGNCDPFKLGENEKVLEIEGVRILACHGHRYSVKQTLLRLAARAKDLNCRVALYGHTHEARENIIDGVTLLNPGTGSRYSEKSYLYLVINGGKFVHKIVPVA